jgi:hypothetical protein
MDLNKFFQSRIFSSTLVVVSAVIVLLLVFALGAFVGFQKARFSFGWGENYHRVFGGPRGGFLPNFVGDDFINGHGTFGTIIKLEPGLLVVKGQDGVEKAFSIGDDTTIEKGRTVLTSNDLKVDEQVVVIGSPKTDGSIEAKLVRVFDRSDSRSAVPLGLPPVGPK